MVGGSGTTASQGSADARRLTGALLAALALLMLTLAFGGEAHACPPGMKADSARILAHKVKQAAIVSAKAAMVSNHVAKTPAALGVCCGGAHGGGPGCQGACCSSCG